MRAALALLLLVIAPLVHAEVTIEDAWSRATPPGAKVGVVYATLRSTAEDEIVGLTSPAADRVELHATSNEGGTMKMRPAPSVKLPANQVVRFASGGLHIMLMDLHAPLAAGAHVEITVRFRSAPAQTVRVPVLAPSDTPPAH